MRYPIIATTLSIVLGGGLALADVGGSASVNAGPATASADADINTQSNIAPPQPAQMDVFFDTDSSSLTYANDTELKKLAAWAKCKKTNVIHLEGHADPRGTVEHNADLSGDRAKAVQAKLIELGAPKDRIVVTLYGELGKKRDTFAEDRRVTAMPSKEQAIVGTR
jgi:outer membrane protein OmpA-like peptidoglycan-associated protein